MLPFEVTIPASVPQRSEIPEGLMNYPVWALNFKGVIVTNSGNLNVRSNYDFT